MTKQVIIFFSLLCGLMSLLVESSESSEMTDKLFESTKYTEAHAVLGMVIHVEPRIVPDIKLLDKDENELNLSTFYGKKLLALHFWATWCAPCLTELPTMSMLKSKIESDKFTIIPISVDRGSPEKIKSFYTKANIDHLEIFLDQQMVAARSLRINGIPATILIDKDGFEIARVIGDRNWSDPNVIKLIQGLVE